MNKLISYLMLLGISWAVQAQEVIVAQDIFLFENYTPRRVVMKDRSIIPAQLNYDCVNQEVYYSENNEDMILTDTDKVEAIFIGGRKFVPAGNAFREEMDTEAGKLFVEWKTKVVNAGKKGAMGVITHGGTVAKADVKMAQMEGFDKTGNEIYNVNPENTYYLQVNNKLKKFKTVKDLCKLFPKEKESQIQAFATREKINIQNPWDVLKLINAI